MVTCTTLETRNIKRDGNGYAFVDMFNFNKIKIVPPAKHVFVSLFCYAFVVEKVNKSPIGFE